MAIQPAALVEFQPEHTDALVAMWRASFQQGVGIVDPHPIEEQRNYFLNEVVPNNCVMVAMMGREIVGFAAASDESIAQLYVHVEHHRQGIGSRLLAWAKSQSSGSLWLYTFECNRVAQQFYESRGFEIIDRGFEAMWQLADIKYLWSRASGGEVPES